jgi:hypothetical protein
VAFLDRTHSGVAELAGMPKNDALEALLEDRPSYGAAVDARHEKAIRRLTELPVFQLRYQSLEDGVGLLARLADEI